MLLSTLVFRMTRPAERTSRKAVMTVGSYAAVWIEHRALKRRTEIHYRQTLAKPHRADAWRHAAEGPHTVGGAVLVRVDGPGAPGDQRARLRAAARDLCHRRDRRADGVQPLPRPWRDTRAASS